MIKKKILFITSHTDGYDGWSTLNSNFINGLKKNGYDLTLLVRNDSRNKVKKNIYPILNFESYYNLFNYMKECKNVKKHFKNKQFDIIICGVEPSLPIAVYLKKLLKIKKLFLIGAGTYAYYPFKYFPFSLFNLRFTKYIDKFIVISNFTKNKVREWYKRELKVIHLGVDINKFHSVKIKKEEKSFIFVGGQKERKGIDILLLAFQKLIKLHPDAKLYIVGSKISIWENYSNELGLKKRVIFTDRISHEELLKYFSKCICHVLPSKNELVKVNGLKYFYFEGFGLVHLEANACGIPSIGSKGTANEEIIIDNKSGFLCKQNDFNELERKMRKIIEDKNLRNNMYKYSLEHAKRYTWEKSIKNLINYIKNE